MSPPEVAVGQTTLGALADFHPTPPRMAGPDPEAYVPPAPPPPAPSPLLKRLLRMADEYRANDGLRQAMEMYFELAEAHEDTPEGIQAAARLLDIAERFERDGKARQARAMYERLL